MKEVSKKKTHHYYWLIAIALIIVAYVIWVFQFSYPDLRPTYVIPSFKTTTNIGNLPLPAYGQSAVGINNYGVFETNGAQTPAPIASVSKLITALCVLQKDPITNVNASPVITLTQADVNIYDSYLAKGGSVVAVVDGEQITEYQMLEAMLLPSANNMADSLAIWAFGSLPNYSAYAASLVKNNGLTQTHIGIDASGFDPSTTSTASDLIKLGQLALSSPIISQIVVMKTATVPIAGTIDNVNSLLGQSNINGIKTGNTTQAGGVYLSSSLLNLNNHNYYLLTAVMGAPTLWDSLNDSYKLITAAQANFIVPARLAAIKSGSIIGYYSVPWSNTKINAVADSGLPLSIWNGDSATVNISLINVSDKSTTGKLVGSISASDARINSSLNAKISLSSSVPQPSRMWLLLHPLVSLR